jgi:hypothetical protein
VHVYRADGGYVGAAECWEDAGFADTAAARRIAAAKKLRRRGLKLQAEAARVFRAEELARDIALAPSPQPSPASGRGRGSAPETRVVRPIFGRSALAVAPEPDEETEAERLLRVAFRQARAGRLALVPDPDDD